MIDDVTPGTATRPPPVIRAACLLLMVSGMASLVFSIPVVLNPTSAQCHLTRTWVDDANTDKKDWNNVDLGGRRPKDLPCDEAVRLADGIRIKEKDPTKTATVPSDSALRIQNLMAAFLGLGQGVSGFILLRTLDKRARTLSLGFSGAGIVLQVLGIISLGVFAFVVYALAFSPASRQIWPREPRPGRGGAEA